MKGKPLLPMLLTATWLLAACGRPAAPPSGEEKLRAVATTTIVGDVVRQIGGEAIALTVLLPPGADPHAFKATPQDMARVAEAQLLFANGAGLEAFLDPLLENAGGQAELVDLSQDMPCVPSARSSPRGGRRRRPRPTPRLERSEQRSSSGRRRSRRPWPRPIRQETLPQNREHNGRAERSNLVPEELALCPGNGQLVTEHFPGEFPDRVRAMGKPGSSSPLVFFF